MDSAGLKQTYGPAAFLLRMTSPRSLSIWLAIWRLMTTDNINRLTTMTFFRVADIGILLYLVKLIVVSKTPVLKVFGFPHRFSRVWGQ